MTHKHLFLLSPSTWVGKGIISFNMSVEKLTFSTTWNVKHKKDGSISCKQEIDIDDIPDKMINQFEFSEIANNKFLVNLTNEILGNVDGKGIVDKEILAWEFRGSDLDFEGYEIFEKQGDLKYLTRAEFTSKDQMRTMIEGSIWQKEEEKQTSSENS